MVIEYEIYFLFSSQIIIKICLFPLVFSTYIYIYISKNRRVAFVVVEPQLHHLIITLIATNYLFSYLFFILTFTIYIYIYIYKDYRLYTFIMVGFNITLNFAFTYSSTLILNLFLFLHISYYTTWTTIKDICALKIN